MSAQEGAGPPHPSIALVVLNWNGVDDTLDCLASLRASNTPVHAIVVDNGSSGSEAEQIRASGLADTVIEGGTNLGYAAGNNLGLRHALTMSPGLEIIGVLNNDTVADPGCFDELARHLDRSDGHPRALAPVAYYFDEPHEIWFAGGVIDRGWPRHLQADELKPKSGSLRPTEWLTGCCIVARAATWRSIGLFDPSYFLIFEDCEWSMRARRAGVDLYVATEGAIRHKVSRSFSSRSALLLGNYYFMRNGLRFDYAFNRKHLAAFAIQHLIRPTLSDFARWHVRPGLGLRWLGALAALTGRTGPAPDVVRRLAVRQEQRTSG